MNIAFYARSFGIRGTAGTYLLIKNLASNFNHLVLAPEPYDSPIVFRSEKIKKIKLSRLIPSNFDREVVKPLKNFQPDVIYIFNFPGWYKLVWLLRKDFPSLKIVLDVQTPLLVENKQQRIEIQKNGIDCQKELSLITSFSCESVKTWIPFCDRSIFEYPLGIDLEYFSKKNPIGSKCGIIKNFAYVASLHPLRKTRNLILAFDEFAKNNTTEVKLDIYGNGPDFDSLQKLVYENNCSSVNLMGLMEQETLLKKLSDYDVGIAWVPYEHYDNSPSLKIIEYMAAKIGILASDTTAHKKLLEDKFSISFFKNQHQDLVAALFRIQAKGFDLNSIQQNFQLVKKFDYAYIASHYIAPALNNICFSTANKHELKNNAIVADLNQVPGTIALAKEKLKIVILINSLGAGKGGAEKVAVDLANEMMSRGHNITVAYQNLGKPAYHVNKQINLIAYEKPWDLRKNLKKIYPDIFFAFYFNRQLINYYYLVHGTGIPFGMQECTNPLRLVTNNWGQGKLQPVLAKWEREVIASGAARIRLVMPSYVNSFPAYLAPSIRAFSNPCFLEDVKNIKQEKDIIIVNGFKRNKNLITLLRAFSACSGSFPDWCLKVVGDNDGDESHKKQIRRFILENKLEDRVKLVGAVDNIANQYKTSKIHVIPSLSEGCPTCVLEAMSCGIPSVGFDDCPGTNELIKNEINGLLASNLNREKSLSESLAKLMLDNKLLERLGKSALKDAEAFNPKLVYDQWEQLFYEAASYKNNMDKLFFEQEKIDREKALHARRMREQYAIATNRPN